MARIRSALLLAAAAIAAAQDVPKPASVSGVVVNGITGQPIAHARVTMVTVESAMNGTPKGYGAMTGDDGTFSWPAVTRGVYDVQVSLRGFLQPGDSPPVEVVPGNAVREIRIKLVPVAVLAGRVLDAHGEPVPGANVQAMGAGNGFRDATADERGEFRFASLEPGKYRLRAMPPPQAGPPELRTDGTAEEWYGPTWYPGTLSKSEAVSLEAAAGAEVRGLEIPLVRIPIVRIAGVVNGVLPGSQRLSIWTDTENQQSARWSSAVNGKFVFWRLAPGPVTISAEARAADGRRLVAYPLKIEVAGSNIDRLALDLVPEFELNGQVQWDGTPPPPDQLRNPAIIGARPGDGFRVEFEPAGSFRAPHITVGDFRLAVGGVPRNVYIESVRIGRESKPGRHMDLRGDPKDTPVTVVLSTAGAEISGLVQTSAGPVAGADICAVLESEAEPASRARSGTDGAFTVRGLAPGRYRIFVASTPDEQPGANPVESLEVQQGEKATRNLTVDQRD